MKEISIFVVGLAMACASAAATAQDLTAGKTPAELFHSDCAECHRSPGGVAGTRDVHALTSFLREHYTTKSETAGALAAYVSSFAGTGAAARNGGTGVAPPVSGEPSPPRHRGQGDAAAAARSNASAIEDGAPRRRRGGISGDVETRRVHNDRDVPRPPGIIAATPAAAAGKTAAPRARKRRNAVGVVPPAPEVPAQTKANDVLTAPDPAGPGTPRQGDVSPPAAAPLP